MNNEEKILEILTQMQQDISDLKTGQANLEAGQAALHKDVEQIKNDIQFMWEDIDRISDRLGVQEDIVKKRVL